MNSLAKIIFIFYCCTMIVSCSKNNETQPSAPVISNLFFTPDTITIKPNTSTFVITGVVNFENASGGVSKLRLTNSAGTDLTITIAPNTEVSGQLSGIFEFVMPSSPGTYTFQIWIIDGKGNSSNKLSGSVEIIVDDSAITWRIVSQSWSLHRVIWANHKYVAVGEEGQLLTSFDGETWTAGSTGTTSTLFGAAWSGTFYVAVGDNKTILTSTDGMNWTIRSTSIPGITLYAVASSGTGCIAVGKNITTNQTEIFNSSDGINWTQNSFVVTGGELYSVRWTGNQYVAVGGVYGGPLLLTSVNGINWINRSSSIDAPGELADVAYSGAKYVAVGYGATAVSSDGVSWNGSMSNWASAGVVWSGNRFVASSVIGVMTSTDGVTWTQTCDFIYPLNSIAWSGLQYVAVGFISPVILVSP